MRVTKTVLIRIDNCPCVHCGEPEVLAHVVELCPACYNIWMQEGKQEALDVGIYKCEGCKKNEGRGFMAWWRRKFPRKARYFINGKHVCKVHAVAEELKNAGRTKEPEDPNSLHLQGP